MYVRLNNLMCFMINLIFAANNYMVTNIGLSRQNLPQKNTPAFLQQHKSRRKRKFITLTQVLKTFYAMINSKL